MVEYRVNIWVVLAGLTSMCVITAVAGFYGGVKAFEKKHTEPKETPPENYANA